MTRLARGFAVVAAVACLATPPARAGDAAITIDNFTFAPATLTVPVGTKVTWTNRDDIPHLVAGSPPLEGVRSPPLDTGDAYSFVFERPGTYRYFCVLHPMMVGSVVVQ